LNIKIVQSGQTQNTGRIMWSVTNRPAAHTTSAARRYLSACPGTQEPCGLKVVAWGSPKAYYRFAEILPCI